MKTKSVAAIFIACFFLVMGCSKNPDGGIPGSYTYKISGSVTLLANSLAGLDDATLAAYRAAGINVEPVTVGLYPEQGQMHIMADEGQNVIVTFNDILGNADVTSATVDGDTLTLSGADVKAARLTDGDATVGAGMVVFGGSGRKYGDMLIMDMQYKGQFTVNDIPMTVLSSDVICVAQQN